MTGSSKRNVLLRPVQVTVEWSAGAEVNLTRPGESANESCDLKGETIPIMERRGAGELVGRQFLS